MMGFFMKDKQNGNRLKDRNGALIQQKNEVSHICSLKLNGKPHLHQINGSTTYYHPYYRLSMKQRRMWKGVTINGAAAQI